MSAPLVLKALSYIVRQDELLIISHPDHPEAGLQVPGGSIHAEEPPELAALHEAHEETGLPLERLHLCRALGVSWFDMSPFGKAQLHQRHFYLIEYNGASAPSWSSAELDASDGTGAHRLECHWVPLGNCPALIAGHDTFLPLLAMWRAHA